MDQKSISQISSAHQLPSFFKLSTLSVPFGSKCLSSSQLSPTQLSTSFKVFKQLKRLLKVSFCWPGCRDGFVRGDVGGTLPLWCVCISDLGASAKTQSLVSTWLLTPKNSSLFWSNGYWTGKRDKTNYFITDRFTSYFSSGKLKFLILMAV